MRAELDRFITDWDPHKVKIEYNGEVVREREGGIAPIRVVTKEGSNALFVIGGRQRVEAYRRVSKAHKALHELSYEVVGRIVAS